MASKQGQHVVLQSLLFRGPLEESAFRALIQDCAGFKGNKYSSSQCSFCRMSDIITYRYVNPEVFDLALRLALKTWFNLPVVLRTLNATSMDREGLLRTSTPLPKRSLKFCINIEADIIYLFVITYSCMDG